MPDAARVRSLGLSVGVMHLTYYSLPPVGCRRRRSAVAELYHDQDGDLPGCGRS
jgi:hypothetical protein